jgi:phenylpyruvate tautomerase PptA (4-oxalocrotonate tautomerase family)
MPILRIESSIPLPPQTARAEAMAAVAECITRDLDVRPVQVRVAFVDVDPENVSVAGQTGPDAPPWIVAWASILSGRPEAQRATFISNMLAVLAKCYRVDEGIIRVLLQEYPSVHWGMGRAAAATKGL